jgi:hypothetical protein
MIVELIILKRRIDIGSSIQDSHNDMRPELASEHFGGCHAMRDYRLHIGVK